MEITLYTIDCPKCEVIEKKLNRANINFKICKDTNLMTEKGISLLPVLEVNGELLNFKEANNWINNLK